MKALKALGSWAAITASALYMVGVYVYYGFGEAPYPKWAHAMLHEPTGLAVYALLMASLLARSIVRLLERLKPLRVTPEAVRAMDEHMELPPDGPVRDVEGLKAWALKRGYKLRETEGGLLCRKGLWGILPGVLLSLCLVVFLGALGVSVHMRKTEEVVLRASQQASPLGQGVTLLKVEAGLPEEFLQVGEAADFRVKGLQALMKDSVGAEFNITSYGPTSHAGLYWRIVHLGFHIPLTVGGRAVGTGELDLLPPGKAQAIDDKGLGGVRVELGSTRTAKKGLLVGRVYDLKHPLFKVSHKKAEPVLLHAGEAKGEVALGQAELSVKVQVVRDPALLWLKVSMLGLVLGLVLMISRLFWYEERMMVAIEGKGRIWVGYSEEFYKKWAVYKFRGWAEGLRPEPIVTENEP